MSMIWFPPLAALLGVFGTRTALTHPHVTKSRQRLRDLVLAVILFWSPLAAWVLSQFVAQEL